MSLSLESIPCASALAEKNGMVTNDDAPRLSRTNQSFSPHSLKSLKLWLGLHACVTDSESYCRGSPQADRASKLGVEAKGQRGLTHRDSVLCSPTVTIHQGRGVLQIPIASYFSHEAGE